MKSSFPNSSNPCRGGGLTAGIRRPRASGLLLFGRPDPSVCFGGESDTIPMRPAFEVVMFNALGAFDSLALIERIANEKSRCTQAPPVRLVALQPRW